MLGQTTWLGSISTEWNNPSNWSNGLPGANNDATIPQSPVGMHFPSITSFLFFNSNVENYGVLKVEAQGAITIFATLINHGGATLIVDETSSNFLIEDSGKLENHGVIFNNGDFNNEGIFTNEPTGSFANSVVFTNAGNGSFFNAGVFDNFGDLYTEADFLNTGTINNYNLLNNNYLATNTGIISTIFGATLRNDQTLVNEPGAAINLHGFFQNNQSFHNQGFFGIFQGGIFENGDLASSSPTASCNNQGTFNNVLCAIFENKGAFQNAALFNNEGIVYEDAAIGPEPITNIGNGASITPGNASGFCQNIQAFLNPTSNQTSVMALDVANEQFEFCSGWQILVNGLPSVSFSGCASVGPHVVNVMLLDPLGRTTLCPSTVTVLEAVPPVVNCPANVSVNLPTGQCSTAVSLPAPVLVFENCGMQGITNNAPGIFPSGPTLVVWSATDQSGNTATCNQVVSVVDPIGPQIACPPNKSLDCLPGICGVPSSSPDIGGDPATATDNCGTPNVFNNAPATLPPGTNTLTWKAVDAFGNSSACTQTITVTDNLPPQIVNCPNSIFVEANLPNCMGQAAWTTIVSTDNCAVASLNISAVSGSIFPVGMHTILATATDVHGNTAQCSFVVNVLDTQAPVIAACPADIVVPLLDCGDFTTATWLPPTASDLCGLTLSSNYQPGDVFDAGLHQVVYTAEDANGNVSNCVFQVNVQADVTVVCPTAIQVSVGSGQSTSVVSWNTPPGSTLCGPCQTLDLPGFQFLGALGGTRYYLYLGGEVTWSEANTIAAGLGGHLVAIGSSQENSFLGNEYLTQVHPTWIGLSDSGQEGVYAWENGEPLVFSNWQGSTAPLNADRDFCVMLTDGTWSDEDIQAKHSFLMELPCLGVSFSATNPNALANQAFPIGTTTVFYEATDACGQTCECSFVVEVFQNQPASYCQAKGNSSQSWIESIENQGFAKTSGNNGGLGDFTAATVTAPTPGCFSSLLPGGPAALSHHYWRAWADLNQDGDFFDPNELFIEIDGKGSLSACYDLPRPLPAGPVRVRVAMSRWEAPQPCGDFSAGEMEDFLVSFIDSSEFSNSGPCVWVFDSILAYNNGYQVTVDWTGHGVDNCKATHFLVERSADGVLYKTIGEVPALQQPSNWPTNYQFLDIAPFYGPNFYRVSAVLHDSSQVVSDRFPLDFPLGPDLMLLYPNPASNSLILLANFPPQSPTQLFISNSLGQIVDRRSTDTPEYQPLVFDVSGYVPGIYTLFFKVEGRREQIQQFVVARRF